MRCWRVLRAIPEVEFLALSTGINPFFGVKINFEENKTAKPYFSYSGRCRLFLVAAAFWSRSRFFSISFL